jgi:hypothetical protein
MIKGVIFFIILFLIIYLIYRFYDKLNSIFRINIVIKYVVIIMCVGGMIFPMFVKNIDSLDSKISIYNLLTKKYSNYR